MPKVLKEKKVLFRAQYKTFGLTYSKCPLDKKEVMDHICTLLPVENYYMVQETHDPSKPGYDAERPNHLHCWFETLTKPNISNANYFDYKGYHCNIGKKKCNWVYNYLKKQDKEPYTDIPDGFIALAKGGEYKLALENFQFLHPKEYVINSLRIDATLRRLGQTVHESKIYPLATEFEIPDYDWKTKSLIIYGPVDMGKTEWVKSYITHKLGKTFLFVTHLDSFKKYAGEDFIIVDEYCPHALSREEVINMTDVANPRDIRCRNTCASIPAGVPKIFTTNKCPDEYFPHDKYGSIIPKRVFVFHAPSIRFY